VPSTVVVLRVRSFALAFYGRTRKYQEAPLGAGGRWSFALKRIFIVVAWAPLYRDRGPIVNERQWKSSG
jgi:hypothetical protein